MPTSSTRAWKVTAAAVVLLVGLCASPAFAQTAPVAAQRFPVGSTLLTSWELADPANASHFRIYAWPETAIGNKVLVSPDIPILLVAGAQEASTITLTGLGRFYLGVVAVNKSAEGIKESDMSNAVLVEMFNPTAPPPPPPIPKPATPQNFRIILKSASVIDGKIVAEFAWEEIKP